MMMQQITVLILLSLINFHSLVFASNLFPKGDLENYGSKSPSFSPDGKKVAYASDKNEPYRYRIWIMDFDGTNKKELTNGSYDSSPAWSPTNDMIAFQRYGPNRKHSIWMLNIKTRDSWEFIEPHPEGDRYPCWSPNGEEIVWSHGKQLWISDSKDSKNARPLTTTAAMANKEICGDWDPSGEWIAYKAPDTYGGPYVFWLIRRNGKDQKLLHYGIRARSRPKWSRDGQSIYFLNGSSLMRVNVRGKCKIDKVYDFNYSHDIFDFDISPDGREVVFSDYGPGNSGTIHVGNLSKEFPWQYRSLTRPTFIISGSDSPTVFKLSNGQCFLYKDYIVHTFPKIDDRLPPGYSRGDDIRVAIKPNGQTIDNMIDPKGTKESFGLRNVPFHNFMGLSGHYLFTVKFVQGSAIRVYNLKDRKLVYTAKYNDYFKIIGDHLLYKKRIGMVESLDQCPPESRPTDMMQLVLAEKVTYDFKRETEVSRKKLCYYIE